MKIDKQKIKILRKVFGDNFVKKVCGETSLEQIFDAYHMLPETVRNEFSLFLEINPCSICGIVPCYCSLTLTDKRQKEIKIASVSGRNIEESLNSLAGKVIVEENSCEYLKYLMNDNGRIIINALDKVGFKAVITVMDDDDPYGITGGFVYSNSAQPHSSISEILTNLQNECLGLLETEEKNEEPFKNVYFANR